MQGYERGSRCCSGRHRPALPWESKDWQGLRAEREINSPVSRLEFIVPQGLCGAPCKSQSHDHPLPSLICHLPCCDLAWSRLLCEEALVVESDRGGYIVCAVVPGRDYDVISEVEAVSSWKV
jgi:hypothetical protein